MLFFPMTGLSILGLLGSVLAGLSSGSFLVFWVCLEVNMLFMLSAIHILESRPESSLNYFIPQGLGSASILLGVFCVSGTLPGGLLLLGLLVKLGAAPFHLWYVGILASESWSIFTILASVQKVLPLMGLYSSALFSSLLLSVVSLGVLFGALGVSRELLLKPMMASFSLVSLSWVLVGGTTGSALFYLWVFTAGLVSLLWAGAQAGATLATGSESGGPARGASVLLAVLSVMGVPPLLGFLGKLCVILSSDLLFSTIPLMVLILGTLVSVFAFLEMYFFWAGVSTQASPSGLSEDNSGSAALLLLIQGAFIAVMLFHVGV